VKGGILGILTRMFYVILEVLKEKGNNGK